MRRFILLALIGVSFAQATTPPKPPPDTKELLAQVQLLREQVAEQQRLLQQLVNPPQPKHPKWRKALSVMDHLGSAASISSVLGVYKK